MLSDIYWHVYVQSFKFTNSIYNGCFPVIIMRYFYLSKPIWIPSPCHSQNKAKKANCIIPDNTYMENSIFISRKVNLIIDYILLAIIFYYRTVEIQLLLPCDLYVSKINPNWSKDFNQTLNILVIINIFVQHCQWNISRVKFVFTFVAFLIWTDLVFTTFSLHITDSTPVKTPM